MNPTQFIKTWSESVLRERQGSQAHFLDLCELLEHPKPQEVDPMGESFCFEMGVGKQGGGDGFADVWKRGFFGWEYKGKHKGLDAAYAQLLLYRDQLENPPLLVVSDMDRIIIRTNYTGTKAAMYEVNLANLAEPRSLEILRAVFHEPAKLKPGAPSRAITEEAAAHIGELAEALRIRGVEPRRAARFLDRMVFCLFAEDVGLLPDGLLTRVLRNTLDKPEVFGRSVSSLFDAMATGGLFGADEIRRFNGKLFEDSEVIPLEPAEIRKLLDAALLAWEAVDPSIFGTLFERGMDPSKRSELGAHYTSRADIEFLVEPVVLKPLRREWTTVKEKVNALLAAGQAKDSPGGRRRIKPQVLKETQTLVFGFQDRLATIRVLDPACGSGNFLYVTLQRLKDLEKEVLLFAADRLGATLQLPRVHPRQFYGIEKNEYAFHLAQLTLWIGFLQWSQANGFGFGKDPVLQPLDNFRKMDAVLDLTDPASPHEPEWPEVEYIVSNPPFLGSKKLRAELGDDYVDRLHALWRGRVKPESDLCVYWFEKARSQIAAGKTARAGLLATQAIRGGANREGLKRIKESGDIFFAESDRDWVLDGANVHVSMVGFDAGKEQERVLHGHHIARINADLTTGTDVTVARRQPENLRISFMGTTKGGAFDINEAVAMPLLHLPNPHGRPNSDVLVPWVNGKDITGRSRGMWIIDYGVGMAEGEAAKYEAVFERVIGTIRPTRHAGSRELAGEGWWQHVRPRPDMRRALAGLRRFLITVRVSKHRLFVWQTPPTLPDSATFAFARSDDYFFGVVHSRVHEVWARAQATQVRDRESGLRYTPTTCFETFPFPLSTPEQQAVIASAAEELDRLRTNWLNPPEWTREEVLEFPGSVDGPWSAHVHDPDGRGMGTVRYPRLVPRDATLVHALAKRTLTNLYNQPPAWLTMAHEKLDRAVAAAYGWEWPLSDEAILDRLLELNMNRAAVGSVPTVPDEAEKE